MYKGAIGAIGDPLGAIGGLTPPKCALPMVEISVFLNSDEFFVTKTKIFTINTSKLNESSRYSNHKQCKGPKSPEGLSVVKTIAFSLILHRLKGDKGCPLIQHVV